MGASENYIEEIKYVFKKFSKPFENMKTEKQCFSKFKNFDTFIVPQSYKIGERKEYTSRPTGSTIKDVPVVGQFIPIRRVLKIFFEMPEIYDKTVEFAEKNNIKYYSKPSVEE